MMGPWTKWATGRGWSDARVQGAGVMGQGWGGRPVASPVQGLGESAFCPPCNCADTSVFYLAGGIMLLGILGTAAYLVVGGHEEKPASGRRLSFEARNLDQTQRV